MKCREYYEYRYKYFCISSSLYVIESQNITLHRIYYERTLPKSNLICSQNSNMETFEHNGVTREYILHVPASYDDTSVPLMFNFHGFGGAAKPNGLGRYERTCK